MISPGSVVRLLSGGPNMTVISTRPGYAHEYVCAYYSEGEFKKVDLPAAALRNVHQPTVVMDVGDLTLVLDNLNALEDQLPVDYENLSEAIQDLNRAHQLTLKRDEAH